MTLGGLIALNVNPMSVFSYRLEMLVDAGYLNPRYSVDDIIAVVRWMCQTNSRVAVRLAKVPVVSGPTNGVDMWDEAFEWGRQLRRWNAGAAESFHYFIIHWTGRPFFWGLLWVLCMFCYYGLFFCSFAPFSLLSTMMWTFTPASRQAIHLSSNADFNITPLQLGIAGLLVQYFVAFVAFYIEERTNRGYRFRKNQDEVGVLRSIVHVILAPFGLMAYGLLSFISVVRFMFEGKRLALHDMAGKSAL
jgi:hypothetical protein